MPSKCSDLWAWAATGTGLWTTRGLEPTADDLRAFHRHNASTGIILIRLLSVALIVLNGLGWASDGILLDGIGGVQPAMSEGRAVMTGFGLLIIGASYLPQLTRWWAAAALAWIGACGLCFGVAWTLGRIGPPSSAWFSYNHGFLFASLLAWASPLHRLGLMLALYGAILGGYFGLSPHHLADPLASSAVTHLSLTALLLLFVGLRLDASRLRLFLYARADERAAERLEAQVAQQTARIQGLLDHVEQAREAERRDLAAELHDEMGQVLTGMRLTLRVARTRAAAEHTPLSGLLDQLGDMVQHLGWAVRNLLVRLRPRVLDDLGFVAAAEWLARRTDELPGVRCAFASAPDIPELPSDAATAAFRVLQEALTNAVRHAGASVIDVRLSASDAGVHIAVSDGGAGFDTDAPPGAGMGLMGMRERARARGGRLLIHSAPGQGTRVELTLPVVDPDPLTATVGDMP